MDHTFPGRGFRPGARPGPDTGPGRPGLARASTFCDGPPVNHLPHGQLGDLAADRPRDVRYLQDLARYVVRARMLPNPAADQLLAGRRRV